MDFDLDFLLRNGGLGRFRIADFHRALEDRAFTHESILRVRVEGHLAALKSYGTHTEYLDLGKNLVVNQGLTSLANIINNSTTNNIPKGFALGSSSTAVSASDTTLVARYGTTGNAKSQKLFTTSSLVGSPANGVKYETLYGQSEAGWTDMNTTDATWNEAGLFSNTSTADNFINMFARRVFTTINKTSAFSINFFWTVTFTAS